MTRDELVADVKKLALIFKEGDLEMAYEGFTNLLQNPGFSSQAPEDQRQTLRYLLLGKRSELKLSLQGKSIDAHRAAILPLTELMSAYDEPCDYEMLGLCHQRLGNEKAAFSIYKSGLQIERERNPQSDLCGVLMSRLSSV